MLNVRDPGSSALPSAVACFGGLAAVCLAACQDPAAAPADGRRVVSSTAIPGLVYYNGFDSREDVAGGIFPDGRFERAGSGWDPGIAASGGGSLRFVVPGMSGPGASGSWRVDFSARMVGAGTDEVYIQWRQRFDATLLEFRFEDSGGFKQLILGEGDPPKGSETGSCSVTEIVVQNTYQRGFPQLYHSCGRYLPLEESIGSGDIRMQNARPSPYCLYSNQRDAGSACFRYVAGEWMTFQLRVAPGPAGTARNPLTGKDEAGFTDSVVQFWGAREHRPSELLHSWTGLVLHDSEGPGRAYGKLWLLPYQTGKQASQEHPETYTWYDELIVSTLPIPDPGSGELPPGILPR